MKEAEQLIRQFGITSKYKGYYIIIHAIQIYIENPNKYIQITKDIYPILSSRFDLSKSSVERNIRTVIEKCWDNLACEEYYEG